MSEIRIQQGININQVNQKKVQEKKEEAVTPELQTKAPEVTPKSADEILNYMANACPPGQVCDTSKTKKIEVSKFVSPEQAAGIAESVNKFFAGMESYVEKAMQEFNLTSSQAQTLVALKFNQQFEDDDAAIIATGQKFLTT